MLVLARSAGQSVVLDDRITVTVIETSGGIVRLGISAPADVGVRRGELDRHTEAQRRARSAHPAARAESGGGEVLGRSLEGAEGVVDVTETRRKSSPSA